MSLKWQVKKLGFRTQRFIELWNEDGILWNILLDNYKIRQEKEKSVGRISQKLEMISN